MVVVDVGNERVEFEFINGCERPHCIHGFLGKSLGPAWFELDKFMTAARNAVIRKEKLSADKKRYYKNKSRKANSLE